jgi:hypothetical protein
VTALRALRTRQTSERLAAGPAYDGESGLVVVEELSRPWRPGLYFDTFRRLAASARVPVPAFMAADTQRCRSWSTVACPSPSWQLGRATPTRRSPSASTYTQPRKASPRRALRSVRSPSCESFVRKAAQNGLVNASCVDAKVPLTWLHAGAGEGTRTPNLPITSRMRYQLRHAGEMPGHRSRWRPGRPKLTDARAHP